MYIVIPAAEFWYRNSALELLSLGMHAPLLIVLLLFSSLACGQSQTGLFLTVPCDKNTPKHSYKPKEKPICITELPLVSLDGFAKIGDLTLAGVNVYFDITLSQEAYKKTNGIASVLTNSSFALVIEDEVFAIIPFKEMRNKIVQRFQGKITDYGLMEAGHTKLKTLIEHSSAN